MAYIETPRTDAGNATFMTNGHNLDDFSVENTFIAPSKESEDLVQQMRHGRSLNLKTPRMRDPLANRRNLPNVPRPGEFTPLLKSVAKNNLNRHNKPRGAPQTPAFLKDGYKGSDTPALPGVESSRIYGEETGSLGGDEGGTPVLQVASSSAQSTPLALPGRDAGGVLTAEGNAMTLREQENIINKIEKENFGLKLKIHFLNDALNKTCPEYNAAALQENTHLKVDKVTLHKELVQARKTVTRTERELEKYRLHLQEAQKDIQRKHINEDLRQELASLRKSVTDKDLEILDLRRKASAAESSVEKVEKLRGDVEDLEAELREKDRLIGDRDEEIDQLKDRVVKETDELADVREELESERERIHGLENEQVNAGKQAEQIKQAQGNLKEALEAREKVEHDLDELQEEMANKSINPKGLNRQLEQKASRLHSDLTGLRQQHSELQIECENKVLEARKLTEELDGVKQAADVRQRRLLDEINLLSNKYDVASQKYESLTSQVQRLENELKAKSEDKDLLHSRHDALTAESQTLQKDLSRAQSKIHDLEESLEDERQHALDNDRQLRSQAEDEISRLSKESNRLQQELDAMTNQYNADQDQWESQQRDVQSQKQRAEERAAGLQRTVNKLQETEGTLSSREGKLQQALESEKQRHRSEIQVLERQIEELKNEVSEKRDTLEDLRSELSQNKDNLRISTQEQATLEEKVQALEDEIEVLQNGLDDEADIAKNKLEAIQQEADSLQRELYVVRQELNRAEASHSDTKAQLTSLQDAMQAGNNSEEVTNAQLQKVEEKLAQTRSEKQSLQDRLATKNLELHSLRTSAADMEAERDEMKSQLKQMQNQVDGTFRLDEEKLGLRTSVLKLENDVGRLREERKSLLERNQATERGLEAEIERASTEEGRLSNEVEDLQRKLALAMEGRDRELQNAKQKVQRLERQVQDLEGQLAQGEHNDGDFAELSILQKDLSVARQKETEYLQGEASQKDSIRDLKQNIARLERQVHESEVSRLAVDSPKSSVSGSTRKSELIEVRRQLTDTRQQLKDLHTKSKEAERTLQRRLLDSERQAQSESEAQDQQREQLETELANCRHEIESHDSKSSAAEKTIARLRARIANLETSLQAARATTENDRTMADERKDLHEMLKDAKLSAEDLQLQISARQSLLDAATAREKELRAQLKRVREERTLQTQKSTALVSELDSVQSSYEAVLDKLSRKQQQWDEEKKAIVSKVRFANTSISEKGDGSQLEAVEKRHIGELKGLARQIQWLRARLNREEGFRVGLAYEKKWLMMRCKMFEACNKVDLSILADMGVAPERKPVVKKTPTLKVVATMVLASCKVKRLAREWSQQKQVKAGLVKGLETLKREKKLKQTGRGALRSGTYQKYLDELAERYRRLYPSTEGIDGVTRIAYRSYYFNRHAAKQREELAVLKPTSKQFWDAAYHYRPLARPADTEFEPLKILKRRNLGSIPRDTENKMGLTDLQYALTDSGAIGYPDVYPSDSPEQELSAKFASKTRYPDYETTEKNGERMKNSKDVPSVVRDTKIFKGYVRISQHYDTFPG